MNKLSPAGNSAKREELFTKLNQVRDQQKELKDSKKAVLTQLDVIQQSMKKKVRFTCVFFIFLLDGSMSCFG
jgi:L-lactate utilization protein LutB